MVINIVSLPERERVREEQGRRRRERERNAISYEQLLLCVEEVPRNRGITCTYTRAAPRSSGSCYARMHPPEFTARHRIPRREHLPGDYASRACMSHCRSLRSHAVYSASD